MNIDVLFINPPWISKDENIWQGIKAAMPPLGLLTMASYLEERGVAVRVLDIHVEKIGEKQLREKIKEYNPRIIGITVLTATAIASHKIAGIVKDVLPRSLVVMGGVHVDALPNETLRNKSVDIVVRGDGEETFWRIVKGYRLETIKGISYRVDLRVVHNPPADVIRDLDSIPHPAYHLVPMEKYYPAIGAYERLPAINMLMTRGCPGRCTFCNSAGTALRTRSADSVVDEIIHLKEKYGIREIQFYDDTFTIFKKNVFRFCELIVERKVNVSWTAFVRADCFSEKMAQAMKEAGCHQVMFGIESGDEEIRRNIHKPINEEITRRAILFAKKQRLEVRTAFMLGNVGETVATMKKTLDFAIALDPDMAIFNVTTPYPGTQLFKWAKENKRLKSEDWSEFEMSKFLLDLPTVSEEEVLKFYLYAHRAFFRRPRVILRRLRKIKNYHHLCDAILAFFYVVLRYKLGTRGEVKGDWMNHKKEDFFDYDLKGEDSTHMTCDTCRIPLTEQELIPRKKVNRLV